MDKLRDQQDFDIVIGRLDRILSEFLILTNKSFDEANKQTLKHHADDLIGVGNKVLENLGEKLGDSF